MGLQNSSIRELTESLRTVPFFSTVDANSILRSLDFFSDVSDATLEEIAGEVVMSGFPAGTIICRHGKFDERLHIILSGTVRAVIPTENNPRFELFRLHRGDFFGEEIVFSSEPRENSIIAETQVMTMSMAIEVLRKLIAASEKVRSLMDEHYRERNLRGDLRRIPLFTDLSDELFDEALRRAEMLSMPKGSIVFREGDRGDALFFIREGKVDVYRTVKGERKLIAILAEGQYFGEMSLLADEARNATVEAVTDMSLVRISQSDFNEIVRRDPGMMADLRVVFEERKKNREDILRDPRIAVTTRKRLDLNRDINTHLDILSQCIIDTPHGGALLATMPGSRYPYVYPRDSACASRFLYKVVTSPLKASESAFRILSEIARFILGCQRQDGYWGQRYGVQGDDKAIYRQEDNVAHGVAILCRYLLAAKAKGIGIQRLEEHVEAINRGFDYAKKNYYRNEIHLFYSTTSIHESAIEEGYSIWVNYAYLLMLRLMERVGREYGLIERFSEAMELKSGFEQTIGRIFTMQGRFVRRLKPNGEIDLRPDITLLSPFFFGSGMERDDFVDSDEFRNSVKFIVQTLWDPDLGMLQRYLPFIEDPHTHVHAGNGPWLQYTSMLAQYYFHVGDIEKGNSILATVDAYKSKEGYLCEHLTTPERFYEFKRLEWLSGSDFDKEFSPGILVPGVTYDLIVEELNHMKNAYDEIERKCRSAGENGHISFAIPLMWSHAEYAMALMLRTEQELAKMERPSNEKP